MNIQIRQNLMLALALILFIIGSSDLLAAEKDYQQEYCKGIMEYRLKDMTRVDCLTEDHAIEYDFGKKWFEAIGQSLHYAAHTGRRAGIVLIIGPGDERYFKRCSDLIKHYNLPIDLWSVEK